MKKGIKIAISGRSGCGNTTVTQLISEKLGLKMINYTFHTMAEELNLPFDEFYVLASKDPKYDYEVDRRQVELAAGGDCVLGSRLAIWMLKDADLKIFLTASPEIRAGRILKREGGDLQVQMAKTATRDEKDHQRYLKLYNIDNNQFDFVDLVIDTGDLDASQVAQKIIDVAEKLT